MRRKIRDRKIREKGVNVPWIAKHFDPDDISERTVKRYVYWFLDYVGVDPETLRGTDKQVRFERPLGEFLVKLIREDLNSGFLKKVRTDQPFTLEEVNQFQERLIARSHRIPEPWKSQIVETDETRAMRKNRDLRKLIMDDLKRLPDIVPQFPPTTQNEIFSRIAPIIHSFEDELSQRIQSK
ncbi:hypothetical protein D2Q93_16740 [Alicyclobacillaceae bacterium I2511]|nr:hypothetical protein D2Q93_16740 [Alicyclobacillaceae bacterium I2511]